MATSKPLKTTREKRSLKSEKLEPVKMRKRTMSEYKSEYSQDNISSYKPKASAKSVKRGKDKEINEDQSSKVNSKNGVIYTKKPQKDLDKHRKSQSILPKPESRYLEYWEAP